MEIAINYHLKSSDNPITSSCFQRIIYQVNAVSFVILYENGIVEGTFMCYICDVSSFSQIFAQKIKIGKCPSTSLLSGFHANSHLST